MQKIWKSHCYTFHLNSFHDTSRIPKIAIYLHSLPMHHHYFLLLQPKIEMKLNIRPAFCHKFTHIMRQVIWWHCASASAHHISLWRILNYPSLFLWWFLFSENSVKRQPLEDCISSQPGMLAERIEGRKP